MSSTARPTGNLVGERLRDIRRQQGLSLAEVEERSAGHWKAVVVGAYERGDRAVTISRLAGLAAFYGVPLSSLLPEPHGATHAPPPSGHEADARGSGRVTLDLRRLDDDAHEALDPIALQAVARFAEHIRLQRGDHNGRVLTVRADDLRTIAVAVGHDPEALLSALREQGAIVTD
ncbi:transcriptional regulator [Egicoccus sp. AB-alg2]|uniref:transcriptional regulator n=1 Tax=Egicoccus sp. AB-alg2 TaxID=3242693 RepID=UPI00359ECFF7